MVQALSQMKQAQDIGLCVFVGCIVLISVLSFCIYKKNKKAKAA